MSVEEPLCPTIVGEAARVAWDGILRNVDDGPARLWDEDIRDADVEGFKGAVGESLLAMIG